MQKVLLCLIMFIGTFSLHSVSHAKASDPEPQKAQPQLASVAVAVAESGNDTPVLLKNADLVMPIASVTKIMTAIIVLDNEQDLNEYLTFTKADKQAMNNYYSRIRIDSRLKRKDVIRIALMSSENFAAMTLAANFPGGREAFVQAMNDKAAELGMSNTRFVDPTGLSEKNVATARDLLKLAEAAASYPKMKEFSTTGQFTANFKGPRYRLGYGNTNALVHRKSWPIAVTKTGYLDIAGRCLLMVTDIDGKQTAMVMLNSYGKRTPLGDAGRIKRWITKGETGKISKKAISYQKEQLALYTDKQTEQVIADSN